MKKLVTRKSKAVCLAEVLVSILIVSFMLCGLAAVTYVPLRIMRYAEDIGVAQDRAEMVLSILTAPLEHCGYGLPKRPDDFKYAFHPVILPFTWSGPLSIEDVMLSGSVRKNNNLKIAYAVGTKSRTLTTKSTDEAEPGNVIEKIPVSDVPELLERGSYDIHNRGNDVKNWVLFGSMMPYCLPARISRIDRKENEITVEFNRPSHYDAPIVVPENDELFYFRVMECQVRHSDGELAFYTRDYMNTGWQPRVDGVVDVRFKLDPSRRSIHIWTLTHGPQRFPDVVTKGTPEGWPEEYAGDIPKEFRHYRLLAVEAVFPLLNL